MSENHSFDVFLSYHWKYHNEIINLHRILTHQGYKVWLDLVEIRFGDHLEERVQNAIRNSASFICFLSEDYIRTKNCELEFYCACNESKKVYIILMEPLYKLNLNLAHHNEKSFYMTSNLLLTQLNNQKFAGELQRCSNSQLSSSNSSLSQEASFTSSSSSSSSSSSPSSSPLSSSPALSDSIEKVDTATKAAVATSTTNKKSYLEYLANKISQFLNLNSLFGALNKPDGKPKRYNSYPSVQAYRT